jgi:hypothetical protein
LECRGSRKVDGEEPADPVKTPQVAGPAHPLVDQVGIPSIYPGVALVKQPMNLVMVIAAERDEVLGRLFPEGTVVAVVELEVGAATDQAAAAETRRLVALPSVRPVARLKVVLVAGNSQLAQAQIERGCLGRRHLFPIDV